MPYQIDLSLLHKGANGWFIVSIAVLLLAFYLKLTLVLVHIILGSLLLGKMGENIELNKERGGQKK